METCVDYCSDEHSSNQMNSDTNLIDSHKVVCQTSVKCAKRKSFLSQQRVLKATDKLHLGCVNIDRVITKTTVQ